MNTHKNARLTPAGRLAVVTRVLAGEPVAAVARGSSVSARTVWKWLARYRDAGAAGLIDRSSRPHRLARRRPRFQHRQILHRRRQRWSSLRTAQHYHLPVSTVVTALRRARLNRLARLEPPRPVVRYEVPRPGAGQTDRPSDPGPARAHPRILSTMSRRRGAALNASMSPE